MVGQSENLRYLAREYARKRLADAGTETWRESIYAARLPKLPTRKACQSAARPCPHVRCRYHLFLDVTPSGTIKYRDKKDVAGLNAMAETCALDAARGNGLTLEEVGTLLNLDRERVRQIQEEALDKLRDYFEDNGLDVNVLPIF